MQTRKRLPRLARILERYLRLFEPAAVQRIEFLERSRLKGKRLGQLRAELERIKARRSGSMLLEVVIGLLITLIGLVGCLSLFIGATDRAVKADRLTRATDLRWNAEAILDARPALLTNPAGAVALPGRSLQPFALDPLGAFLVAGPAAGTFGNLPRYGGGCATLADAEALAYSPDTWVTAFEAFGTNPTATTIDLAGLQGSTFTVPSKPACRILLTDAKMTAAQERSPVTLAGNTVSWGPPLPAGFTPARARLELQDRRYSWLMTVRPDDVTYAVDVAIYFNRSFDVADESPVPATFRLLSSVAYLQAPAARIKAGSWLFDSDNARWYRATKAIDVGNGLAAVSLEVPALADSPAAGGFAVLPGRIVDVFPVGAKSVR